MWLFDCLISHCLKSYLKSASGRNAVQRAPQSSQTFRPPLSLFPEAVVWPGQLCSSHYADSSFQRLLLANCRVLSKSETYLQISFEQLCKLTKTLPSRNFTLYWKHHNCPRWPLYKRNHTIIVSKFFFETFSDFFFCWKPPNRRSKPTSKQNIHQVWEIKT